MDLKKAIDALLSLLTDLVMAIQERKTWRWFKRVIRRRLWKPFIKPAMDSQDFSWVSDALLILLLVKLLVGKYISASANTQLKRAALGNASPANVGALLNKLVG